jgi:signal transduction histidine kinase
MNHSSSEVNPAAQLARPVLNTILIVEDVPANIDILLGVLEDEYSVSVALDGRNALMSVETVNPDLILLDIMMPGMDGYQVCAKLKEDPATREIPVIFLTAMNEDADEEKGLRLGAVDYITKPFNPGIVKARVRTHLALRQARLEALGQRDQIQAAYQKLNELETLRDDLVHMVVHDMRSPLTGLGMFLDLLSPEEVQRPDFPATLRMMREASRALADMVSSLLDVSRLEAGQMPLHPEACDLEQLTHAARQQLSGLIQDRQISISPSDPPVVAQCDPVITERIIQNLLGNALKFTPVEGSIRIEVSREGPWARFSITDTGPGIPAEYHEKVFQKFGQAELRKDRKQPSSGLGLAFCKLAVEAQGGGIQLESEPGRGTTFHVRLPHHPPGKSG